MAHKHHRKKKYHSVTDRPIFKALSAMITTGMFALLYYIIVILMQHPSVALTCSMPCVLVLLWVALKQRHFWWVWLIGACPSIVMILVFRQPKIAFLIQSFYWAISYGMCMWLVFANSRAKHRSKKKKSNHHHSDEPPVPRPRDELLEKLFADAK